jgi:succinate dehydrogenase / fumarate reductase cytochrome b subunit
MSESVKNSKRQFRNISLVDLTRYRFPIGSIVSILHRISGAFMFLLLPLILWLLDKSLYSEISFDYFKGVTEHWFVRLVMLVLVWAYLHHVCAGVRHLLMDMHMGLDKPTSKQSGILVLSVSLTLTALIALKLFGAF